MNFKNIRREKWMTPLSFRLFFRALLLELYQWLKRLFHGRTMTMEDYIYKIARVTGNSEYEIFCKSAESWPINEEKIERDFSVYLSDRTVPYYVIDFIRKNKKHIDELHIPLF
jgi:hypothetical protein